MNLRTPLITFERIKFSLVIIIYAVGAERVDPRPFFGTSFSKWLLVLLFLEVTRQAVTWRLEVSHEAVLVHAGLKDRWRLFRSRFTTDARYRMRRAVTILVGLYTLGWIIDLMTTRCNGPLQCAWLFPRLAIENLPFALQMMFVMSMGLLQLGGMFYAMTKVGFIKIVLPGTVDVTFDDIYGQDRAVDKMKEQVRLLEDDEVVTRAGGYMPKGVMLYGPPGTGKTMLAKAAANASTKPLILVPPGAFVSTFMGINFLKVGMFFRTLRKYSLRYKGAYGFIDEIDSLGNRGMVPQSVAVEPPSELGLPASCTTLPSSETAASAEPVDFGWTGRLVHRMFIGGGADSGTINAFLAAMDGMEEPRGLINRLLRMLSLKPLAPPKYKYMLVGATNLLAKVDVALLRAGRFDRKILVTHPKYEGRKATYDGYMDKVTHTLSDEDIAWAARNHFKGTGAEIRDIVNEALLVTFRDGRPSDEAGIVTKLDLMNAMLWKKAGESDGLFEVKYNQWSTAIHESGHAVVQHHLRSKRERIWIASIEQRGAAGGVVWPVPLDDDWHMDKSEMEANVMVSLGSRVAEYLFFGEMSNGHGGDGPNATRNVEQMVLLGHTFNWQFRKDKKKGRIAYTYARRSDEFQDEVEDYLFELLRRTKKLLETRKDQIEAVAKLLIEKHTVAGEEIHDMLTEMEEAR